MPESTTREDASAKEAKVWTSGKPYRYPLPKPDGDPWDILLQPYLKKDQLQCDRWKEEIYYLLIFAGLFSIVMAIFVLHSLQALQVTATEVSANALILLVDRLDSIALNGTSSLPASQILPRFFAAPSRSSIRISILWFISFILSLSTLVIGVVILQWITEYQRYADEISTKEMAAMYHMRSEAFKKWRVPQIVSYLSVLLLLAVVFFFSGIIVFLFAINRTLAITITVFIGLILFFLLITTLLPTLQCFFLTFREPSRKKDVPSQCPYKSPQSWLIYYSLAWIFKYSFSWGRNVPLAIFLQRHHMSWANFDSWWIRVRNTYSQFIHGVFDLSSIDPKAPGYDEAKIITHTMQNYSETSKCVLAAYYCFHDVSKTVLTLDNKDDLQDLTSTLRRRNQLLHMQYWSSSVYGKITSASNQIDESADVHKMHDENMMLFLWLPGDRSYPDPIARGVASHILELQTRRLNYTMLQGSLEDTHQVDDREVYWLSRILKQYWRNAIDLPWTIALHRRVSREVIEVSVNQYVLILDSFFRRYATEIGQAWSLADIRNNKHGRTMIHNFLSVAVFFKSHLFERSTSPYNLHFRSTLSFIGSILQSSYTRTETHERHDFIFFAIVYLLDHVFQGDATLPIGEEGIPVELVKGLSVYEMTVDKEAWASVFSGNYVLGNWTTQLQAYEQRASEVHELRAKTPTQTEITAQLAITEQVEHVEKVKETTQKFKAANSKVPSTLSFSRHLSGDTAVASAQESQIATPSDSQEIYQVHGRQKVHQDSTANAYVARDTQSADSRTLAAVNTTGESTPSWEVQEFLERAQSSDDQVVPDLQGQSGYMQRRDEDQGFQSQETASFEQRQMQINSQNNQDNSNLSRNNRYSNISQNGQDTQILQIDASGDHNSSRVSVKRYETSDEEGRIQEYGQTSRTTAISAISPTWEVQEFQGRAQSSDGQVVLNVQGKSGYMQRVNEGQTFRSQETADFEQQQTQISSQNNQYNSELTRTDQQWNIAQNRLDTQNLQINSRTDQNSNTTSLMRYEMSEEERRRQEYNQMIQWQQTQRFSENSESYNTTTTTQRFDTSRINRYDSYGSFNSRHNQSFSWASQSSNEVAHEEVDGNLFY